MTQSLVILGRQPTLGLAELESLYGPKAIKPLAGSAAILDIAPRDIDFNRLGGSVKLCTLLNILDTSDWRELEKYLSKMIPEHLQYVPEGKFKLGISAYGLRVRPADINATNLRLKKIVKAEGRSVRVVPNKATSLNSAQVLHNQLTSATGWELVFYRAGAKTYVGLTSAEQDIEAYARRDQNRPMRDAKVGMLPPKLAQIIINLATGPIDKSLVTSHQSLAAQETRDKKLETTKPPVLLDPFCGTGVVLQEALLMDYSVYGSDIEPRMVEYSTENLDWLAKRSDQHYDIRLEPGDATNHTWFKPSALAIASETYLGKPLSREPDADLLHKIMAECDIIHYKTLQNFTRQLEKGTRLCLAVPAWRYKNGFKHLPTLDKLKELGYTRMSFVHAPTREMLYYREDQYVARELVVLIKE